VPGAKPKCRVEASRYIEAPFLFSGTVALNRQRNTWHMTRWPDPFDLTFDICPLPFDLAKRLAHDPLA
jgi:hypothetical protein